MASSLAPYKPLDAFSTSSSPAFDYTAPKLPRQSLPTLNEMLARIEAAKTQPHRSFIGTIEHGAKLALDPVAWTFDKLERPAYAVANAYDKGLSSHHVDLGAALHGAREGFMGRQKVNFGQVFKDKGLFNGHGILRGVAGLGADVVLDPFSYTGAGAARKIGVKALDDATKVLFKGTPYSHTAAQAVGRISELQKAHNVLAGAGKEFEHRAALAKMSLDANVRTAAGHAVDDTTRASINAARNAAWAEHKLHTQRFLKLRVGPNSGGLSVRTPVKLPGHAALGNAGIPVLSKVASSLGKAFKPGYEDPILHAQLLGRRHQGERLAMNYFHFIRDRFRGLTGLTAQEQRQALHYFEKPGRYKAVIKDRKTGEYVLNPLHLARAAKVLSSNQIEFVKAMHDVGQFFAKKHAEYGLEVEHLGAKGQLYVPHIVTKSGEGLTDAQRNLLTKRGFTKARKGNLSVAELHGLHMAGQLPHDIETNPYRLLTIHARSVANQHSDQIMVNYMRDALGVPTRLVDKAALGKARTARVAMEKVIASHPAFDEAGHQQAIDDLIKKHEQLAHQGYGDTLRKNNALIREHLENRDWTQTTMATVKRISQRSVEAQGKLSEDVKAIREQRHPALLKELNPLKAQKTDYLKNVKSMTRKLSRLQSVENKILKGSKNPAYQAATMRTVGKLTNEFGHKYAFNHQVADSIERLSKVMSGDEETLNAFSNGYRKWLGKWKVAVTTVNPSYGVRNTLSDYWNMYLSGVPLHAIPTYGAKAAKLMRDASKGDKVAVSKMLDAYDSGILSGLFAGDVQQVSNMLEHGSSAAAMLKKKQGIKLVNKITQDINRNRENWGRLTHYLYRLDQGKGVAEAADLVKAAHFDYEDLTPFEQKRMKVVAPFYTWSRKNIPFQIKAIVEHPGQMAAFPQFGQEAAQASGGKKNEIIPPYMEQGMFLKLPFGGGKYFNPMIGIQDLQNAAHPTQLIQNLLSPAIKTPFEMLTNHNMMTGQPIADPTSYSRTPINDSMAGLLSLIPGSNVGPTGRKLADGTMAHGAGASPYLTYLLGQTPITNNLVNKGGRIKDAQHPNDKNRALMTELFGINAQSVDQNQQRAFEQLAFQDHMKQVMKDLRAEGLIPPVGKKASSKQQQIIQDILFHQLGG